MGGMLRRDSPASYPDLTERVVINNPIGLTERVGGRGARRTMRIRPPWRRLTTRLPGVLRQYRRYFPALEPEYEQYVRILYARR